MTDTPPANPRWFRLYANCIPVRGARRSVICDLQRCALHLIPNALYEILTVQGMTPVEEIYDGFALEDRPTVEQYFAFLSERELGFWTSTPERFPALETTFSAPGVIDAAVIDVSHDSVHDYAMLVGQLDELGTRFLHVRSFTTLERINLDALLGALRRSRLRGVELTLRYSAAVTDERLLQLCASEQRISGVLVHGADQLATVTSPLGVPVRYLTRVIRSPADCGYVHPSYFAVSLPTFTEALRFNTCLNRKVSIDAHGQVCNCSAMKERFGEAQNGNLRSTVSTPAFRAVWQISKDEVEVCRDCEFRYVCTDCRAHVQNPANPRSKPANCSYDPYSATWQSAGDTAGRV